MRFVKPIIVGLLTAFLVACGGGGGSSSSGGGNGPNPPTPATATGVNIGNVATLPISNSKASTSAIVSNNFSSQLVLKSASYILYEPSGPSEPRNAMVANTLVNTSLCQTVQAQGTCSIILNAPANATQGQYLITLEFINLGDQKVYSTSQLISYSNAVSTNDATGNGAQVSPINNTLYNIPNGSTTYSIPFVLTKPITNLTAVSDYSNPAFSPVINCDGTAPYQAGTACTLFIRVSQTGDASLVSGNVTVYTTDGSSSAQIKSKANAKGTTGYLFNVPVTVVQNNTGNLITSAVNVVESPANGTSPQTITLFNNGAGSITGITIYGTGSSVIESNNCTSTLTAASTCTFKVNGTVTQNSQGIVVVNYSSNGSINSLSFNVIFIIPGSTVGLSMVASSTVLTNTVINTTSTSNITVQNNAQTTLSNVTFSTLAAPFSYSANSSCATNGTQSLSAGQSCTLILNYSPTVTAGASNITIRGSANYTNPGGGTSSYESATASISYSAIAGSAFVYITPNYVAYGIRADNSDTATQTFVIVNSGPVSTTVNPESNASPPVTGYSQTAATCSFPQTLGAAGSGTESCTISMRFGPTTTLLSNSTSQMTATYTTIGTSTANTFANLSFTSSTAALVSIASISATGTTTGNGQATGTAYQFKNSPESNPSVQFTITYQNTGNESALNFSVVLNALPVGYYPTGGTCNAGANGTSTLAKTNGTCTVIFAAESTALYNSYSLNGDLSFNFPGWSYTDTTGLNTNSSPNLTGFTSGKVWVTANALSSAVESTPPNWTTAGAGGVNTLTFNTGTAGNVITILNTGNFSPSITFGGSGQCTIVGTTCTITVTNLSLLPITTYNFLYLVSPTSSFPTQGIIKSGTFTYTS